MPNQAPTLLRRLTNTLLKALAGTAFAVLLLVPVEGALRLALGAPEPLFLRSFPHLDPAFEERGDTLHPTFQDGDAIEPFGKTAAHGVPRVIFLGGSSLRAGSDLPVEAEFPQLVAQLLSDQGAPIEALNLGRPAIDSHSLNYLAPQLGALHADLAVLYLGHNDIGNITMQERYGSFGGSMVQRTKAAASHLQLYTQLQRVAGSAEVRQRIVDGTPVAPARVQAAESAFAANLDQTVATLQAQGTSVVLITPVSDIVNTAPGAPMCAARLPPKALSFGKAYVIDVDRISKTHLDGALKRQPNCTDLRFIRGVKSWNKGYVDRALPDLLYARAHDPIPRRATPAIEQAIREVAERRGTGLIDLAAASERDGPSPEWFIDVVHFSALGHAAVADAIAPELAKRLHR